ncbi:16S rRNA (uracil(1498)-N(3))-methyltransferase [Flammeovirga aprica]|uniref:Ribosomal RNA small subunit methyltransferase E n=1 Tax=Flammeovirga aprica JL-4 TaxID=694437 RepID=A0A7X9RW68_9BACT|nr:16S rRNA (uracil(1498)-N(3))-methyltransferase [Flammeovirga aprica]NME69840.1 16S rRNA (uracil(1498)-N(3))-methyltransferase [Flammeovirga aprica JL-4]
MRLFYHKDINPDQNEVTLTSEDSKHIVRVLRMQNSEQLHLMDGRGNRYTCTIIDAHQKKCKVKVDGVETLPPTASHIHIGIAPTKNMDRIEFFLEKAIEIGVGKITFFYSKHSERKQLKLDRLERIAVSAMKQSRKFWTPELTIASSFKETLAIEADQKFIAYVPTDATENLFQKIEKDQNILVLVGPEGGFSEEEAELAKENSFEWVSLGKERLRTETAGIVTAQILNMVDLK